MSQGLKSERERNLCFSDFELFTDGGPRMIVGGKRASEEGSWGIVNGE